jgi:hypothetical protein
LAHHCNEHGCNNSFYPRLSNFLRNTVFAAQSHTQRQNAAGPMRIFQNDRQCTWKMDHRAWQEALVRSPPRHAYDCYRMSSGPAAGGSPHGSRVKNGRVEMWRGGCRLNISVAAPFVWRCLSGSSVAPFLHPAHRTGRADFPHPALGQDLTPLFDVRRHLRDPFHRGHKK